MNSNITESIVEQAAHDWLGGLGYEALSGLELAPGEPAAGRADYKHVFLFYWLQTKLEDWNLQIPLEGQQGALPPERRSGELRTPAVGKISQPPQERSKTFP